MEYVAMTKMDALSLQSNREVFETLAACDEDLTIDMDKVDLIDGAGIGALVYLLKRARAKRRAIRLTKLKGQPKRLLEDLHLLSLTTL